GPPVVDQLLADGTGHLVASMGDATRPVPFSSFMATRETLARDRERLVRFVRGLARAQRWIAASRASEIAAVIAPAFPAIDARFLTRALLLGHPIPARTQSRTQGEAGRDGVHGHAERAELERELARERDDPALGRRIGAAARGAQSPAGDRRDVDDLAPVLAFHHRGDRVAEQ